DIGIQRGPDQVGGVEFRLQGDFAYDGPIDLRHSTVTLFQLFAEMGNGGAGELIKTVNAANFLPITLASSKNSQVDEALYQSPSAFRPQLRFQFERKAGDVWEFKLRLDRGLARQQPRLCTFDANGRQLHTFMTNSFTISDGVNPPIQVGIVAPWQCNLSGFQMRTP